MAWSLKKPLGNIGKNLGNALFGKSGPQNPYSPPDITALLGNTGQFDYLKSAAKNPFVDDLTSGFKSASDFYKAPTSNKQDAAFQDLIGSLGASNEGRTAQMEALLSGIDQDTERSMGNVKMDLFERGLGGAGLLSDIETSGLAQAQSAGQQQKTQARTTLASQQLEDIMNAMGLKYNAATASDAAEADRAARFALSDQSTWDSLLGQQAQLGESQASREDAQLRELASLLSGRDVAAAGNLSELYTSGQEQRQQGRRPGLLESGFEKFWNEFMTGSGAASKKKMF